MRKAIYPIIVICITGMIITFSCKEEDFTYSGPLMAEFPASSQSLYLELLKEPVADLDTFIMIQYVGPQQSTDKSVGYEIVADQTDAIENVHYEVGGTTITIPAHSSFGYLPITVKHSGFMVQEEVTLTLKLVTSDDMGVSEYNNTATITMYKKDFCPYTRDDIIGTWPITEVSAAGGCSWGGMVTITAGGGDTIFIDGLWYNGPVTLWGETMIDSEPTAFIFDTSDEANPILYIPYPQLLNRSLDPDGVTVYTYGIMQDPSKTGSYEYCKKLLKVYYYEIYGAAPSQLQDIVETTIDASGS